MSYHCSRTVSSKRHVVGRTLGGLLWQFPGPDSAVGRDLRLVVIGWARRVRVRRDVCSKVGRRFALDEKPSLTASRKPMYLLKPSPRRSILGKNHSSQTPNFALRDIRGHNCHSDASPQAEPTAGFVDQLVCLHGARPNAPRQRDACPLGCWFHHLPIHQPWLYLKVGLGLDAHRSRRPH
jgi:hypothetical protein